MTSAGVRVIASSDRPTPGAHLPRRALVLGVACILLLEIALFSWSFGQFFCGDSLFYLWYRVQTRTQVIHVLSEEDHLHSYRPLTYLAVSFLLFPLFGLNPLGYHFVSLGAHLLISLLVFRLLRELVAKPAAALAGALFFGVHAVNFYITYDVSFLPDFGGGFFYVAALIGYATWVRRRRRLWLAAGLACFVMALLFKESSVTLPVGVVVLAWLVRRRSEAGVSGEPERPWWRSILAVTSFFVVAALYLGWLHHQKAGSIYPRGAHEPYALTLAPAVLQLKLRYLAWLANLPTQFARRGWLGYAAVAAMLPALAWIIARAARSARRLWRELLLCAGWVLAGLLPVLFISQLPMKHNLYMPVVACAIGLALMVEATQVDSRLLPRGWAWLAAGMVAATGFQVPGDLNNSWVGEASHIARASLDALKREHPALPRSALLYVLPTQVKGTVAWYFQGGGLFNLFYNDPTLRTRFADLGASLPEDFPQRPEVFIFHFHDHRLWDVTRQYKRDALDRDSYRLLEQLSQARIETHLNWKAADLPDGKGPVTVRPLARNGQSRQALIAVAGTKVRFEVPPIPPHSVLQVGASIAGPLKSGNRGQIFFEEAGKSELLVSVTLDAIPDAQHWWDKEVDLSPLAGRQGALVLETPDDRDADWLVWSRLRIIQRTNPFHAETSREVDQWLPPRAYRLLDRFEEAQTSFDRNEFYPDYARFDTPGGKPVFLYAARRGHPGHFAMVTIAGATAKFTLERIPPGSALEVAAINLGKLGDGVRGRVFVEANGGREAIFDALLPAGGDEWVGRTVSLEKWAGKPAVLAFEGSSGPQRETIADWCAWGRLRIVPNAKP